MTAREQVANRRRICSRKTSLRHVYRDFHERLLAAAPGERVLEVGAAAAGVRQSLDAIEGRVVALDATAWEDIGRWALLPSRGVGPLLALEERALPVLGPVAAFRFLGVLERTDGDSG